MRAATALFIILAAGSWLALAGPAAALAAPAQAAVPAADSGEATGALEIIVGEVVSSSKGLVLRAEDGDYRLKGVDASKDLGRQVEVMGVVSDDDQPVPVLTAKRYKVLR